MKGADLLGRTHQPLFDDFRSHPNAFQVIAAEHVTTENGTGLVHMAPDFGEDDYVACQSNNIGVLQSVDNEGNFTDAVSEFAAKTSKKPIQKSFARLRRWAGSVRHDTIQHSYPFCYRSGTPLI